MSKPSFVSISWFSDLDGHWTDTELMPLSGQARQQVMRGMWSALRNTLSNSAPPAARTTQQQGQTIATFPRPVHSLTGETAVGSGQANGLCSGQCAIYFASSEWNPYRANSPSCAQAEESPSTLGIQMYGSWSTAMPYLVKEGAEQAAEQRTKH